MEKIHKRIAPTLGDLFPCYKTVKLKLDEFKRGRTSIKDAPHLEAPKSAMTPENI